MKKLILAAAFVACALGANAQIWMGGSFGLDFKNNQGDAKTSLNDETQTTFMIQPEVGYVLDEKWDLAIGLGFSSLTNVGGVKDASWTTFTVNPYARYTFANSGKLGFFVDGGVEIGVVSPKEGDSKTSFFIGLRPGVKFAASDKFTLVAHIGSLGYMSVQDNYNEFGLDVDNKGLSFGIYYSF